MDATLVTTESDARDVVRALANEQTIACDLESDGLFAYRAGLCLVQLATESRAFVFDTIAVPPACLVEILGERGPRKIIHDVAFDARLLAENGVRLGNAHDTALAARMLGRTATGLGNLLTSELGHNVDKSMQSHDWRKRPLDAKAIEYLVADVAHLFALHDKLWAEIDALRIDAEVCEETKHRIATAIRGGERGETRAPYLRMKAIERAPKDDLPILRRLAELREERAASLDVPPHKVLTSDVLYAIARARPRTLADLRKIRGATEGARAGSMTSDVLAAVERGLKDGPPPAHELAELERPRISPEIVRARRSRESRLVAWRKIEAKARGVDEQVVLPGHVVKSLANAEVARVEDLREIAGLGDFRLARHGEILMTLLRDEPGAAFHQADVTDEGAGDA